MVKNIKAKRGVGTAKRHKPSATKPQRPKDAMDALSNLFNKSAAMTEAEKKSGKKQAKTKTSRSVVRKQRKVKIAGSNRKQKRKGVN
jgi:hypothetical protein